MVHGCRRGWLTSLRRTTILPSRTRMYSWREPSCMRDVSACLKCERARRSCILEPCGGHRTAILAELPGSGGKFSDMRWRLLCPDVRPRTHRTTRKSRSSTARDRAPTCPSAIASTSTPGDTSRHGLASGTRAGRRLLLPLQPTDGSGGMLLVSRGENDDAWSARFVQGAGFMPYQGLRNDHRGLRLAAAFTKGCPEQRPGLRARSGRTRAQAAVSRRTFGSPISRISIGSPTAMAPVLSGTRFWPNITPPDASLR